MAGWVEVRFSVSSISAGRRVRRTITQYLKSQSAGCTQGSPRKTCWLDNSPIQESEYIGELAKGNYGNKSKVTAIKNGKTVNTVYDLEVEDVHVYYAENVLVSNCHRCKDGKTQNARLLLAAKAAGAYIICLSATVADNPMQMKAVGSAIGLFKPSGFFPWCMDHGVFRGRFGMEFRGGLETIKRIHKAIFPERGNRTRIADLGDAFPETLICAEAYSLNGETDKINAVYERMAEEIAKLNAKKEIDARERNACILTEILRARQESELLKVPVLTEMTEDALEEGSSVIIFTNFNETVDALMRNLKTKCVIRGGQSSEERQANIDAFQADTSRVIIANIRAGGVGVSLHDLHGNHPRLALICPTYSAQDLRQSLGRCHRAGGKTKSVQRIVYAAGTIEEKACAAARSKLSRIETLNDGDVQQGFPEIATGE
jgi:hypothetical protein